MIPRNWFINQLRVSLDEVNSDVTIEGIRAFADYLDSHNTGIIKLEDFLHTLFEHQAWFNPI